MSLQERHPHSEPATKDIQLYMPLYMDGKSLGDAEQATVQATVDVLAQAVKYGC